MLFTHKHQLHCSSQLSQLHNTDQSFTFYNVLFWPLLALFIEQLGEMTGNGMRESGKDAACVHEL